MSLPEDDRRTLHDIARASIKYSLEHGSDARYERTLNLDDFSTALQEQRATFVTLNMNN